MEEELLAEGYWCRNCGFFEEEIHGNGNTCVACGCHNHDHIIAKVEAK